MYLPCAMRTFRKILFLYLKSVLEFIGYQVEDERCDARDFQVSSARQYAETSLVLSSK